jgi:hypothetical protein
MPQQPQNSQQRAELMDLAALLADLRNKWPDLYRHIMGMIKTVVRK